MSKISAKSLDCRVESTLGELHDMLEAGGAATVLPEGKYKALAVSLLRLARDVLEAEEPYAPPVFNEHVFKRFMQNNPDLSTMIDRKLHKDSANQTVFEHKC